MPRPSVFGRFAQSLAEAGTPDGQTPELVEKGLLSRYDELFAAIRQFSDLLNYQFKDLSLSSELMNVDRDRRSATCAVNLVGHSPGIRWVFDISHDGIQANRPPLSTASAEGKGWWSFNDQEDFIERLGIEILRSQNLGPNKS